MTTVWTIGHSTRPIGEFIELLEAQHVTRVADIRSMPGSRHNPQFGQGALEEELRRAGLSYTYLKALGGLRKAANDSTNTGWRNASFRNYADYMQTEDFRRGIDALLASARRQPTAIMCAEAVPWRCHRSLVGDALLVRGVHVVDIIGPGDPRPHTLTSFAVVDGTKVTYPPP